MICWLLSVSRRPPTRRAGGSRDRGRGFEPTNVGCYTGSIRLRPANGIDRCGTTAGRVGRQSDHFLAVSISTTLAWPRRFAHSRGVAQGGSSAALCFAPRLSNNSTMPAWPNFAAQAHRIVRQRRIRPEDGGGRLHIAVIAEDLDRTRRPVRRQQLDHPLVLVHDRPRQAVGRALDRATRMGALLEQQGRHLEMAGGGRGRRGRVRTGRRLPRRGWDRPRVPAAVSRSRGDRARRHSSAANPIRDNRSGNPKPGWPTRRPPAPWPGRVPGHPHLPPCKGRNRPHACASAPAPPLASPAGPGEHPASPGRNSPRW